MRKNQWSREQIEFLKETYPHWGTLKIVEKFGIDLMRARHKADKLKLKMLPKSKRLCVECNSGYQKQREYVCQECFNKRRKIQRRNSPVSILQRFKEMVRAYKHRSDKCDIDAEFLVDLYNKQNGLCHYSKIPMTFTKYGTGRNPYSVTVDQVMPGAGYTKNNVVLCCMAVNSGKSWLSVKEYVDVCKKVVDNMTLNNI
jgi:hypothetical protein